MDSSSDVDLPGFLHSAFYQLCSDHAEPTSRKYRCFPLLLLSALTPWLPGSYAFELQLAGMWHVITDNTSYTLALLALMYMYVAVRNLVAQYHPVRKFLAVKLIVFATYWQSLVVAAIPGVDDVTLSQWNDFVLCIEMVIFSLLHLRGFPVSDFLAKPRAKTFKAALIQVLTCRRLARDFSISFHGSPKQGGSEIESYRGVGLLSTVEQENFPSQNGASDDLSLQSEEI